MEGIGIVLFLIIGAILTAIICLIKGYQAINANEKDTEAYTKGKSTLRTGIMISIVIFAALLIGSSLCLGMLG